jgi:methionyl-tRNA formyltransferase
MAPGPRILFVGMRGAFSSPVLEALVDDGLEVCAVAVPQGRPGASPRRLPPGLPIASAEPNIIQLADRHGIPAYEGLPDLEADVLAVACFDRLIARAYWSRFKWSVNVHPSLLPDNRGPAPLFWTFRLGQTLTGVTVHLLSDRADAGPILAQRAVPVPDGVDGAAFERDLARAGGELLAGVIEKLPAPVAQDEARASYHPWPQPSDWFIPTDRSARWAFNFIHGVGHLDGPFIVGGYVIAGAIAYDPVGVLGSAFRSRGDLLDVQMSPGVLTVRV